MYRLNLAILILVPWALTAAAEDIPDYADQEFGEYLSSQCVTCHKNKSSKGIVEFCGKFIVE